jgi:hypothetical protein
VIEMTRLDGIELDLAPDDKLQRSLRELAGQPG